LSSFPSTSPLVPLARKYLSKGEVRSHLQTVQTVSDDGGSFLRAAALARAAVTLHDEAEELKALKSGEQIKLIAMDDKLINDIIIAESTGDMAALAEGDLAKLQGDLEGVVGEMLFELGQDGLEVADEVVFEISAGVGGQEAMLFSKDLFDLYGAWFEFRGWDFDTLAYDASEIG
jgi:protein subunit release factor A